MSPLDYNTIQAKLLRLESNISLLEKYAALTTQAFLHDPTVQGATLHYLVESIEIIIDIANHLLADRGVSPVNYYDTILQLGKIKIVPSAFAKRHADMTKFRNLIVHVYMDVDVPKVYRMLRTAPKTLRQFARYFEKAAAVGQKNK